MSRAKKTIFFICFFLSLLFNAAVIFVGGVWLVGRLHPIVVTPSEMSRVIKGLSWNSAGEWRVVEHDEKRILIEYRLPIYDITRYELPAKYFRLSDKLREVSAPFQLSYEGCDVLSRTEERAEFNCIKFRDLSPKNYELQ
jgi:hypothetical protein